MQEPSAPASDGCSVDARHSDAIDWSVLDALKALQKPGLCRRLITVYLNSSPALMDNLRESIAKRDSQGLTYSAHTLKSSSMSVGALRFGAVCAELEKLGRAGDMNDIRITTQLSRANTEFSAVCAAFRDALEQDV